MKYYLISNSAEEKEVGSFPQTSGLFEGYNHSAPNAMGNLTSDEFPRFIPDLRFTLDEDEGAILTDVVSPSNLDFAKGLLLNDKARKVFESFKIIPHKYYHAFLKVNNKLLDYYWLHLVNPTFNFIDFKSSVFVEFLPGYLTKEQRFQTEDDFEKFYPYSNKVQADKIVLIKSIEDQKYDLMYFRFIHKGLIASEQLCNSLKSERITGLIFKEQEFI